MRLLDRYLLREFLVPLGYCLGGFLIFWLSFDLLSELGVYQEKGLKVAEVVRLYLSKTPELMVVAAPIALLLALLYSLTNHGRHQELTAMRAAGIGVWRICAPYLALGILFSLALLALNELWVPKSSERVESILRTHDTELELTNGERWQLNLNFRNARHGRIWNIEAFNLDTSEMRNPHVSWQSPDGNRHSLIASSARRTNGIWVFHDVQKFFYVSRGDFDPASTSAKVLSVPEFSETPEQIRSEIKIGRVTGVQAAKEPQLSIEEISNYLRLHPILSTRDHALLYTQWHARLAWPWTCLVVVLIAIPFGAASGRRNVFVGVASSIFLCFLFFVLLRFGLALGTGGWLPPWVAAWMPNILFGTAGITMTQRVR
ncbi:MAG: LptF/LptG family permease [Verrucomicrobia bacterium]|nr:LptF/LptG family permease [Verrucomicrobiota bacterium]